MDIVIDGNRDIASADSGSLVGDILDQLQAWLGRNGRAVVALTLDGKGLDDETRKRVRADKVDSHRTLDVVTLCPSELSLLTLSEVAKHLPSLAKTFVEAAATFQRGNAPLGMNLLCDAVTGLQVTMDTLTKVCHLQGIDLGKVKVGQKSALDAVHHMGDRLRDVQAALKSKDSVTLADMSEYELAPAVKDWEGIIRQLEESIRKQHS